MICVWFHNNNTHAVLLVLLWSNNSTAVVVYRSELPTKGFMQHIQHADLSGCSEEKAESWENMVVDLQTIQS